MSRRERSSTIAIGVDHTDGMDLIAMEYVGGKTLDELILTALCKQRRARMLSDASKDLLYGVRVLAESPGFTGVVPLTPGDDDLQQMIRKGLCRPATS